MALLYGNCPLIFKHTCSFSNYSVLFSRLIYRCFITLFSTCIFDYNCKTFCSCKFISCVLKSEYMSLNIYNWILNIIELINPSAVFAFGDFNIHHKDWLTFFIILNNLTQIVNFHTWILNCDSHSPPLLELFLSSDASICSTKALPQLGNSDHAVVSVSINFPINSKQDALFHHMAYDYFGDSLNDHLRDVWWEDIFKFSASATASEFCH